MVSLLINVTISLTVDELIVKKTHGPPTFIHKLDLRPRKEKLQTFTRLQRLEHEKIKYTGFKTATLLHVFKKILQGKQGGCQSFLSFEI